MYVQARLMQGFGLVTGNPLQGSIKILALLLFMTTVHCGTSPKKQQSQNLLTDTILNKTGDLL